MSKIFIKLLKKYTTIDNDFIDTFFKKFKIGDDLEFHIKDTDVSNYLNIELRTLRKRLLNTFSKNELYVENVDFIRIKNDGVSNIDYMINYQCFERLAMASKSEKSEEIRLYFTKLREFISDNYNILYQSMENKLELDKYNKFETIYFFAIDDRHNDIIKIGRSSNITKRLSNYNVGRIKEVELKYLALVKNSKLIEKCMKNMLKDYQIYKGREIYKVDSKYIKKVIDDCYCKNVKNEKNDELYEEVAQLLGLYSYIKDKVNIKPYVIIGKNIKILDK